MKIDFVTLFPETIRSVMNGGVFSRASRRGFFEPRVVNPRDFSDDGSGRVDDRPYGGGPGMILSAEPLYKAIKSVKKKGSRVIFLSPQGRPFDQEAARRLSGERHLIMVCGHYEGVDARAARLFDEEISIGDYVLSGGELPALVVAEAVLRLVPGVIVKPEAVQTESFSDDLLEYPQYTKPRLWRGRRVPEVLLSGDHGRISDWRRRSAEKTTLSKRPDLKGLKLTKSRT